MKKHKGMIGKSLMERIKDRELRTLASRIIELEAKRAATFKGQVNNGWFRCVMYCAKCDRLRFHEHPKTEATLTGADIAELRDCPECGGNWGPLKFPEGIGYDELNDLSITIGLDLANKAMKYVLDGTLPDRCEAVA